MPIAHVGLLAGLEDDPDEWVFDLPDVVATLIDNCLVERPDESHRMRALSGSYDRTLNLWNLETGEQITYIALDVPIWSVALHKKDDVLIVVAGDEAGSVYCFEVK